MKKLTKIILLLLALSLTLAVPFTVSASEIEPSLKIEAANLSFEDSVYPVFAVSSKDVDASSIKLLVWTSPKTSESEYIKGTEAAELTSYADETIDGVPCKKFKYTKLYAKNMTDDIYVRAYAEVDGELVYSDIVKYSVLKYAYNKLGYTGTESQSASFKKLLNATLAQGAAAQEYFEYKIDRLADARYYQISVEGGYLADGTSSGLYLANDSITVTAPATDSEGRLFVEWLDENGISVSEDAVYTFSVGKANATYTASYEPKLDAGAGVEALAYTVNSDGTTCTITGIGGCKETAINIPEYMGEYKVTAIGEKAFADCTDLTFIKIPDTVKTIGTRAFYGCTGLTEMTIPESVTSIGTQIFYKASNLSTVYYNSTYVSSDYNQFLNLSHVTKIVFGGSYLPAIRGNTAVKEVEILDTVKSISSYAFRGCTSLTSVEIPDSVTSIGYDAFYDCSSLTSVVIPDNVTSIGSSAFYGCTSLTSVVIGDSVTSIGDSAFYNCSSLKEVYYTGSVEDWCNISFSSYNSNPMRSGANLYINGTLLTELVIPDSVTSIRDYAFYGCSSLTSIEIPDSVTSIGDWAFYDCSSLVSIVIPDSVTSIGSYAFRDCSSLTSVVIPDSVTSVGECAFNGCTNLTSIEIPDSVTSIGSRMFDGCSSLTSIEIPDSVTSIGDWAFDGCSSLVSIVIPDSVTSIREDAFRYCSSLKDVYYTGSVEKWCNISFETSNSNPMYLGANLYINGTLLTELVIPDSVTRIGDYAFGGCTSLTSVVIPDSVTSIGSGAFSNCSSLTSIEIPDSVTSIGNHAFSDCTSLTSVVIGDSVTSIGDWAFDGCSSLTSVVIPDSVTRIGWYAFYGCTSLTSVVIGDSVTSIGDWAFYGCSSLNDVYYTGTEEQWGDISIGNYNYSLTNATIHYNYGKEPVGTEGLEYELQSNDTYAVVDYTGTANEVVIPSTYEGKAVTSIGKDAFYECTSLTSISITNSVTSIGSNAFYGCSNLTSIVIPDSVTSIGDYAFYGCTSIESITIPESVTYIGPKAINSCKEIVWNFSGFSKWEVYIPSIVGKDPYESYQTKTLTNLRLIITIASDPAYVNYANKCLRNTVTVDSGVDYNVAGHDYRITLCYGNYALTRVS